MGFIKKIIKWMAIFFAGILLLIVVAGIAVMLIVDKPFIEGLMEKQLHRQVRIGDTSTGIFSAVSGFTVSDIKISNFKSEKALEALKNKPVPDNDLFASVKSIRLRVSILPLLKKQFVLKELMIHTPQINIVRYKSGAFNFSDLLLPKKMTPEEKAKLEEKLRKEATEPKEASKPLSADDIPLALNIGSVGMDDGNINFADQSSGQKISIYKITAKVYDISIDTENLEKHDTVSLKIFAGIKTTGRQKSGGVESFDIGFDVNGKIIPFDRKSRLLNPEVSVKAGTPYGSITGLQIFNEMMNVEQLAKYSGKLDFLKKEINWKNGYVKIHYKDNVATLEDGKIANDDYSILFGGKINTVTKSLDFKTDMTLAAKHTAKIKEKTSKLADKLITGKAKGLVKADQISDTAMKPLLNDKGEVYLKDSIKGTIVKPSVKLVHPVLGTLSDITKSAVKDIAGDVAGNAKKAAMNKADEKINEEKKKQAEKAKGKLKKLF